MIRNPGKTWNNRGCERICWSIFVPFNLMPEYDVDRDDDA
jgi:hypothetical protein